MQITKEDMCWYWFCNMKGIGRKTRNKLLEKFLSPINIYNADEAEIKKLDFLNTINKDTIIESRKRSFNKEIEKVFTKGIHFIHKESVYYPEKLHAIPDPPHSIYIKTERNLDFTKPAVAVVGSRKCSKYGYETAYKIGYELAMNGISVVSGMASGIDSAAHRGCVEANGYPIAVLGCGVDICYPKHNINLYVDISRQGMIISEYAMSTQPKPGLFPERNRIISGLGDIIIVVEAGEKSGTFITVDTSLEQGREVYAVPGRISDVQSKGCNSLISQGAHVFQHIDEIIEYIDKVYRDRRSDYKVNNASEEEIYVNKIKKIYDFVRIMPKHLDEIAEEVNISFDEVVRIIFEMELKGIIKHCGNNFYVV